MKGKNKHASFYYSGINHLNTSLQAYSKSAISDYESIYLFADDFTEDEVISRNKFIKPISLVDLVIKNSEEGLLATKKDFDYFVSRHIVQGYSRVNIIGQVSNCINKTSKELFMNFEENLTDLIEGVPCSILCIYDMEDYQNEKKFIDEDVMFQSFHSHTHQLVNLEFKACV